MLAETQTRRLILTPLSPSPETARAVFALQSDPATWQHLPDGVETDISQTRSLIEDHDRSWRVDGLGWWAVRSRVPLSGVGTNTIIGLGGAGIRIPEIPAWNLGYRLSPAAWGHGFAAEVGAAALAAARNARPELPVTARALTRNPASWRTLDRIGLEMIWEGDAKADHALTSGLSRRIYSDRPFGPSLLDQLIALG